MVSPVAAAGGAQDALVALFVVLLVAKLGEEACSADRAADHHRARSSPVGPSVLGIVEPDAILAATAPAPATTPEQAKLPSRRETPHKQPTRHNESILSMA